MNTTHPLSFWALDLPNVKLGRGQRISSGWLQVEQHLPGSKAWDHDQKIRGDSDFRLLKSTRFFWEHHLPGSLRHCVNHRPCTFLQDLHREISTVFVRSEGKPQRWWGQLGEPLGSRKSSTYLCLQMFFYHTLAFSLIDLFTGMINPHILSDSLQRLLVFHPQCFSS